jgi:hypothetical protein
MKKLQTQVKLRRKGAQFLAGQSSEGFFMFRKRNPLQAAVDARKHDSGDEDS